MPIWKSRREAALKPDRSSGPSFMRTQSSSVETKPASVTRLYQPRSPLETLPSASAAV